MIIIIIVIIIIVIIIIVIIIIVITSSLPSSSLSRHRASSPLNHLLLGDHENSVFYFVAPKCDAIIPEEGSFAMKPDDNLGGLFVTSNRRMTRKGSRKGRKSKDFSQVKLELYKYS